MCLIIAIRNGQIVVSHCSSYSPAVEASSLAFLNDDIAVSRLEPPTTAAALSRVLSTRLSWVVARGLEHSIRMW